MGDLIGTEEYQSFRSTVQKKKVVVDESGNKYWTLYDAGPRCVRSPVIFLPPASGKADIFFRQIMALSAMGYRTLAVEYPVYWTLKEFNEGFRKLLDHLNFSKVHLFGASLGGFLAQKFAEFTSICPRVASLVLCNSFVDTTVFQQTSSAPMFWMMPSFALKRMVMGGFDKGYVDKDIADSIDFSVGCLDSMNQQELASRLTLNCMNSYVQPQNLSDLPVTIIDVYDECALSQQVQDEVYKCFPHAKRAHLKSGGNFPYLSRSAEVNMYLQIHLRPFLNTPLSASQKSEEDSYT